MQLNGIDIGQLAELTSQVATTGALGMVGAIGDQFLRVTDQVFEFTIGMVVITSELTGN